MITYLFITCSMGIGYAIHSYRYYGLWSIWIPLIAPLFIPIIVGAVLSEYSHNL